MADLLLAYFTWAQTYYNSFEFDNLRYASRPLKTVHGVTLIDDFGPVQLKQVREEMIRLGWARTHINSQIGRLRRIFNWGVEHGMVQPGTAHLLRSVAPLKLGRTNATESRPVSPVGDSDVDEVLPFLSPAVAAMVKLQRLTGMRSSNLCSLTMGEIDRSQEVWIYRPSKHKTTYRGQDLFVCMGPESQKVLNPFLDGRQPDEFLFSPAATVAWQNGERAKRRKTPRPRANNKMARSGKARRRKPIKSPGRKYTARSYRRAVIYGIEAANRKREESAAQGKLSAKGKANGKTARSNATAVAKISWTPHQLRHTRATTIRKEYGVEGAQVSLGHSTANVTQVYAERDLSLAVRIAREMG